MCCPILCPAKSGALLRVKPHAVDDGPVKPRSCNQCIREIAVEQPRSGEIHAPQIDTSEGNVGPVVEAEVLAGIESANLQQCAEVLGRRLGDGLNVFGQNLI